MNKKNLICYNEYCAFNANNKCVRTEISLNRVGVCEDMFLISTNNFKNITNLKEQYIKNAPNPTNKIMQKDVDWFHKQMNSKEVHPLETMLNEIQNSDNKKRTK